MKKALWILLTLTVACAVPPPRPVEPPRQTLVVTLVDDVRLKPVVGTVSLDERPAPIVRETDGNGRAEFNVAPGPRGLLACAPDFECERVEAIDNSLNAGGSKPNFESVALHRSKPLIAPLPSKAEFYRDYQANFGGIELKGCGLRNDILFDPQLLPMWLFDRPCYDRAMEEHAKRNDTRVVVSPAICYHEGFAGPCADVWHQPNRFREFLVDIRSHRNAAGETIEPHVILGQGEHDDWYPLLKFSQEGVPDPEKEAHVIRDFTALAQVTQDVIAGTAPFWEPRHQKDWMTPGQFERIGMAVARLWPNAWHGIHLIKESSSWASWRCDPETIVDGRRGLDWPVGDRRRCGLENIEGDDPNRGSEPVAWQRCRKASPMWCDGIMYQVPDGPKFLTPRDGDPANDWKDRAAEIATRLGRGGLWGVNVDVMWWEFIYDRFNGRASEALLEQRCREAQRIYLAPCGSASVRAQR